MDRRRFLGGLFGAGTVTLLDPPRSEGTKPGEPRATLPSVDTPTTCVVLSLPVSDDIPTGSPVMLSEGGVVVTPPSVLDKTVGIVSKKRQVVTRGEMALDHTWKQGTGLYLGESGSLVTFLPRLGWIIHAGYALGHGRFYVYLHALGRRM